MTDAMRDAELLADALAADLVRGTARGVALAGYQAQRDRLSRACSPPPTASPRYDWDLPAVQPLLREVSSAMSDEVELLQALPAAAAALRLVRPARPPDMLAGRQ